MTREEAKEDMYKYLLNDYDLTRNEAKDTFEMKHIEKIYDDFKEDMMKIKEELLCCSRSFIGADGFLINIRNIIDKWVK